METKIVSNHETTNNGSKTRRSLRKGEYPVMEEKLYQWLLNKRNIFIPVNGTTLKLKATGIQNQFCTGIFMLMMAGYPELRKGMAYNFLKIFIKRRFSRSV